MEINYTEEQKKDIGRMMGVYLKLITTTERYKHQKHPENALYLIEAIDTFFEEVPRDIRNKIKGACSDTSWKGLKKRLLK